MMKAPGFTMLELVVVILIIIGLYFFMPLLVLLLGWMFFPGWIADELEFSPRMVVWASVLLVLAMVLAHNILAWLHIHLRVKGFEKAPRWRVGSSVRVVLALLLFFTAGLSLLGLLGMSVRAIASDEYVLSRDRYLYYRVQSSSNLKHIGRGVHDYHDRFTTLPAGGTFNEFGEMQHGWMTALLPYMEYVDEEIDIKLGLPWNHPDQGDAFKTQIPEFLNPSIDTTQDSEGYALSHYSANSRVMGGRKPLSMREIRDGTSNTILAGEVNHDFSPWGHPVNWRDPAHGINQPRGFGSHRLFRGTQFVFVDGSARFISQDIDPEVLKALATPDGGEDLAGTMGW